MALTSCNAYNRDTIVITYSPASLVLLRNCRGMFIYIITGPLSRAVYSHTVPVRDDGLFQVPVSRKHNNRTEG